MKTKIPTTFAALAFSFTSATAENAPPAAPPQTGQPLVIPANESPSSSPLPQKASNLAEATHLALEKEMVESRKADSARLEKNESTMPKATVQTAQPGAILVTGEVSKLMDGAFELNQGGSTLTIEAGPDLKPQDGQSLEIGQQLIVFVKEGKGTKPGNPLQGAAIITYQPSSTERAGALNSEAPFSSSSASVELTGAVSGYSSGTLTIDTGVQGFVVDTSKVIFRPEESFSESLEIGDPVAVVVPISNDLFNGSTVVATSLNTSAQ